MRSPASGYKVRKWPKRSKVSCLPTLVVPLGGLWSTNNFFFVMQHNFLTRFICLKYFLFLLVIMPVQNNYINFLKMG